MTLGAIQRLCQFLTCALNELIAVSEPDVVNGYRHSAVIRSQIAATMRHRKGITKHLWHRLSDVEKTEIVRRLYNLVSLLSSHAASMQRERLLERVPVEFQLSGNEVFIKHIMLAHTVALIDRCLLDMSGGPEDDEVYNDDDVDGAGRGGPPGGRPGHSSKRRRTRTEKAPADMDRQVYCMMQVCVRCGQPFAARCSESLVGK